MSRQGTVPLVLICIAHLLFLVTTFAEIMDEFREPSRNNMGGHRSLTSIRDLHEVGRAWDDNTELPCGTIALHPPNDLLIEMFAPNHACIDVSAMALNISYTSTNGGWSTLIFLTHMRDQHRIGTPFFHTRVLLLEGRNHFIIPLSNFEGADLAQAQGFGISGNMLIHQIELVDDPVFINITAVDPVDPIEPLPIPDVYPANHWEHRIDNGIQTSIRIDYVSVILDLRLSHTPRLPWSQGLSILPGVGIEITNGGFLILSLPDTECKFIKIDYSSAFLGIRTVHLSTDSELRQALARPGEASMNVIFNQGPNKHVVLPLPRSSIDNRPLTIRGIHINGPLIVHRLELLHSPPTLELAPGDSMSDALLMDDFSDWRDGYVNNLGSVRNSLGTRGTGFISLNRQEQYLVEHFAYAVDGWDLHQLAIRVTYTSETAVTCDLALIPESVNDIFSVTGYPTGTLMLKNSTFQAANKSRLVIPMSTLIRNHPLILTRFVGLLIHGPKTEGVNAQLILHRVELMSNIPYFEPIPVPASAAARSRLFSTVAVHAKKSDSFQVKLDCLENNLRFLRKIETVDLPVSRDSVLQDAYQIVNIDKHELRKRIYIKFDGERGADQGGVTREFFSLLANEINNPNYALFTALEDAGYALQINPNSVVQGDNHLDQFKLIGRVIGLAILNKALLGVRFVPSIYTKIINEATNELVELPELLDVDDSDVDISRLKIIDPKLYECLNWYLDHDICEIPDMTMTVGFDFFGENVVMDLVKNGSQHVVTQANKKQYVREYAKFRLETMIEPQANALRDGVWDIVPHELLSSFTESELEHVIAGKYEIDLDDWKAHTAYENTFTSDHPSILLFWECLQDWDNEKRSRLLQFVTGSPRVPYTGFAGLAGDKFTIREVEHDLPKAYTCFNRLDLPAFNTSEIMCQRLELTARPDLFAFGLG